MVRLTKQREGRNPALLFRHIGGLLAAAAVLVFLIEPVAFAGTTPLIARLEEESRASLYEQLVPVSASLLGFYVAAVAILTALDSRQTIVEELKRGEAFKLLIVNMLGAILLLFVLTVVGVIGSVLDPGDGFQAAYEWIVLGALFELTLSGFFFAVVIYKAAIK